MNEGDAWPLRGTPLCMFLSAEWLVLGNQSVASDRLLGARTGSRTLSGLLHHEGKLKMYQVTKCERRQILGAGSKLK